MDKNRANENDHDCYIFCKKHNEIGKEALANFGVKGIQGTSEETQQKNKRKSEAEKRRLQNKQKKALNLRDQTVDHFSEEGSDDENEEDFDELEVENEQEDEQMHDTITRPRKRPAQRKTANYKQQPISDYQQPAKKVA